MREEIISTEGINSVDIYGVNDRNLEKFRHFFPGVRILARGSEIRLEGEDQQVGLLKERILAIIDNIRKGDILNDSELERLVGTRTNVIARKLRSVEQLPEQQARELLDDAVSSIDLPGQS